jgi:RNA polymerase sigma-70 factor (ECF subfamily)
VALLQGTSTMATAEQLLQQTLVLRCQLGERSALEELFVRHNRALGYYLGQLLGRDEVADVQQEVWLSVLRRIGQLREPEAFIVWLYQIARNRAISRRGKRGAITSLDELEEVAADPDVEFSPEDAALVHQQMAHLSDKHREVLTLRFIEDLSYEQIASVIGCTPGTVRSRLHYAKAALRKQLETSHESIPDA